MGGASAWHLATHHAGLWCSASPGAGFAETAIYNKHSRPEKTADGVGADAVALV